MRAAWWWLQQRAIDGLLRLIGWKPDPDDPGRGPFG